MGCCSSVPVVGFTGSGNLPARPPARQRLSCFPSLCRLLTPASVQEQEDTSDGRFCFPTRMLHPALPLQLLSDQVSTLTSSLPQKSDGLRREKSPRKTFAFSASSTALLSTKLSTRVETAVIDEMPRRKGSGYCGRIFMSLGRVLSWRQGCI